MHSGKSYTLAEFLKWTRRKLIWPAIISTTATALYLFAGFTWLAIPWTVLALLGTATAFIVGFKNQQTYNRTWEARQIWGGAMGASRSWAIMCRDFIDDRETAQTLIYRHLAWITALRYQLRAPRHWETMTKAHNREYSKYFSVPEAQTPLEEELAKYISAEEIAQVFGTKNRAAQLLSLQSKAVRAIHDDGAIDGLQFSDMHKAVRDLYDHQGKSERMKNFPYPRQYATMNLILVNLFSILLPFGMLGEFNKLNDHVTGFMKGNMALLVIPFSMLISWVYFSLEQVGESTENPFEGNANDVPISQMSRAVEIDIREMLGEKDLPPALVAERQILL